MSLKPVIKQCMNIIQTYTLYIFDHTDKFKCVSIRSLIISHKQPRKLNKHSYDSLLTQYVVITKVRVFSFLFFFLFFFQYKNK